MHYATPSLPSNHTNDRTRWHALWMEEARGVTLHALNADSRARHLALEIMSKQLNGTHVSTRGGREG